MRRAWILAIAGLMLMASTAQGQKWFRRWGWYNQQTPVEQLIANAFSLQRAEGMDDWAWRDAVESRLAGLGKKAMPLLALEAQRRKGYEADAARVALFRLENDVNPRAALEAWAENQKLAELKVRRVMGLRDLLPHHLIYVVEFAPQAGTQARERRVVAVAADTKVQVLSDDASLGRFLGVELATARVDALRENVAELACQIAAARFADVYEVTGMEKDAGPLKAEARMKAGTLNGQTEVAFGEDGRVKEVTSAFTGGSPGRVEPAVLPERKTVPAMPE